MPRLKNLIKKLHLKKGDILIIHPSLEEQFQNLKRPDVDFRVPMIITTNVRNIRVISLEQLKKIMAEMEKDKMEEDER